MASSETVVRPWMVSYSGRNMAASTESWLHSTSFSTAASSVEQVWSLAVHTCCAAAGPTAGSGPEMRSVKANGSGGAPKARTVAYSAGDLMVPSRPYWQPLGLRAIFSQPF